MSSLDAMVLWWCPVPVPIGKAAKLVFFVRFAEMVFCVAGVGLRDIVLCLQNVSNVILCDTRATFERFAGDEWQTFVAGAAR